MARINSRSKGQRGERECSTLVQEVVDKVWMDLGKDFEERPILSRNLVQTRNGGHDLVGLDWIALEVKFCETLQLDRWWDQAKRQANQHSNVVKCDVEPILIYRQSRKPWRIQMFGRLPGLKAKVRVDISLNAFLVWFEAQCRVRL